MKFAKETTAICPICNHKQTFEDASRMVAQAWLSGHIQAQHSDELPPFEVEE